MKIESRIFEVVAGFCFIMAVIYGLWAKEPVGIVALTLTGGLCLITGTYFRFVARRIPERPEDDTEAEVSDGAGELGFFSPGSYWPIGIALCTLIAGIGIAYWTVWVIILGMVFTIVGAAALVFEYYTGARRGAH